MLNDNGIATLVSAAWLDVDLTVWLAVFRYLSRAVDLLPTSLR
jgi:hypothetical protein